ncbi:MAG TPA: cupredoxin family copper-binding protein [Mycobacterium sp.]|nr:cupredoxin family copper-binding protein [Mycobacterium sp.]
MLVVTAAAILLAAGCSSSSPHPTQPSVTFGSGVSGTPGMPGMSSMPPMATSGSSSATSSAPVAGTAVSIDNFAFSPASLTVKAGSTVTWTNHDEEPHTVVANDNSFHSPGLDANGTYSYTFHAPGTFDYICSIHPFMHGTVVVTA